MVTETLLEPSHTHAAMFNSVQWRKTADNYPRVIKCVIAAKTPFLTCGPIFVNY
jgi:hypothetical protein